MKNLAWIILFFLLQFNLPAQTKISGIVTDLNDTPIPNATVYLSKTTFGVMANIKGEYLLSIPQNGTYELFASCIGFKTHSQIIKLTGNDKKINIKLSEQVILIKELTVKGKDLNRQQNYEQFLLSFIGNTRNAQFCTIKNPEDLIVYHESTGNNLIAYSIKPLTIINSALGYKIIYDLKSFSYELNTRHLRFSGYYYFQDISSQKRENSRTNRNRLIAYYGSRMHFLRALFDGRVGQDKFEICDIGSDSCGTRIVTNSINENEILLKITADSMAIYHTSPIFISYVDHHPELFPLPQVFYQHTYTSRIAFSDTLQVYKNGYYPDCYSISWSGDMASERIADMLPYDYIPNKL